jgi:hypothetical protein
MRLGYLVKKEAGGRNMTTDGFATVGPGGENIRCQNATASPRWRNETRRLSLMSRLSVNLELCGES